MLSNAVAQFGLAKGAVVGSDAGRTTNVDAVPMTVDILVRLPRERSRVRGRSRTVGGRGWPRSLAARGSSKGATGTLTVTAIPHTGDLSKRLPAARHQAALQE